VPVAVAEESNPSLVIAETVDDPLIVERSTDLEPLIEAASGLATLTLNRPEKLNAYLPAMGDEIVHAFVLPVQFDLL